MTSLTDIPSDILEEILQSSDPYDVASIAATARTFHSLVYESADQHLWRALYLAQPLDDPRLCVSMNGKPRSAIDWKGELQRIMRAQSVLANIKRCRQHERCTILKTLLDMVCNVPPLSSAYNSSQLSQNLLWVAAFMRRGAFIDHINWVPSDEEFQLRARLHTYFGLTPADVRRARRVESRAYVYNMRNYRWGNNFGPFLMDSSGRVNWVHMRELHHVLSMHIIDLQEDEDFDFTIFQMSLPFTQITIPDAMNLDQEKDWAGVSGSWRCSFCFCDHRELLSTSCRVVRYHYLT